MDALLNTVYGATSAMLSRANSCAPSNTTASIESNDNDRVTTTSSIILKTIMVTDQFPIVIGVHAPFQTI